jgi:hypothetical protein
MLRLPLMLTPTGLAVGLEPLSVPDAAGTVSPNPSNGIMGSPLARTFRPLSRQRTAGGISAVVREVKRVELRYYIVFARLTVLWDWSLLMVVIPRSFIALPDRIN